MTKNNTKEDTYFDSPAYWKEIEDAIVSGKVKSIPNLEQEKKHLALSARNTRLKTKKISMRVNEADLARLRSHALREGMPYQTVINSLIHKYVMGNSSRLA